MKTRHFAVLLSTILAAPLLTVFLLQETLKTPRSTSGRLPVAEKADHAIYQVHAPLSFPQPHSPSVPSPKAVPITRSIADATAAAQMGRQLSDRLARIAQKKENKTNRLFGGPSRKPTASAEEASHKQAIRDLLNSLKPETVLEMDDASRTLRYLRGNLQSLVQDSPAFQTARQAADSGGMALATLQEVGAVLRVDRPDREFVLHDVVQDNLGMVHVKLRQHYQGIPIWGAEIGVHFNAQQDPIEVSGVYIPTPNGIRNAAVRIGEARAVQNAKASLSMQDEGRLLPTVQKIIYWDTDRAPVLCYNVSLAPSYTQAWDVFVSTADGSIVHKYDKVKTGDCPAQGTDLKDNPRQFHCWETQGQYYAFDSSKPMFDPASNPPERYNGTIYAMDFRNQDPKSADLYFYYIKTTNPQTWDKTAVTIMHYLPMVYDYFAKHDRNSLDGRGMNVGAVIHFRFLSQDGRDYNDNACWNPAMKMLFFGDGDEIAGGALPYAKDMVAHEFTHGVSDFSAGFIYENQSGALHEHFSDFFGCMIDRDDWLMGEDVINYEGKTAFRDLQNPENPTVMSTCPAHMKDYYNWPLEQDRGGVHRNCGIPGRMAYLLCDGPSGIGKEKAEKILFKALTSYLTQKSGFIDYRRAAVSAAEDLHGQNAAEVEAVRQAFDAVGIQEKGDPVKPTPTPLPSGGEEALVYLEADPGTAKQDRFRNEDYFYRLMMSFKGETKPVSSRLVANSRPAISGDGQWGLFIDKNNNLCWTNGNEADEEQLTNNGAVRTLAMSCDQKYVAFTTVNYDNIIHVIDTTLKDTSNNTMEFVLTIPMQNAGPINLTCADVMTFNFQGNSILFDGVYEAKKSTGEKWYSWGIYCLQIADQSVYPVFLPSENEQITNPHFAHNNDMLLLADLVKFEKTRTRNTLISLDFNQHKIGGLLPQLELLALPSFRGDDQTVVYRTYDSGTQTYFLKESQLGADKLSLVPNSERLLLSGSSPISFPIGFRIGEYQPQQGKIEVPREIRLDPIPVLDVGRKQISIQNTGTADLKILGISFEGGQANWFRHNGSNETLEPGSQMIFQLSCLPQSAGPFQTTMHIRSDDLSLPDAVIPVSGTAVETVQPTSNPTTVVPTATPVGACQPLLVYEFNHSKLGDCGWNEIPGGFNNSPPGSIGLTSLFGNISSSKDQRGLALSVSPKQVAFLYAAEPVQTGQKPVLLRLTLRSDSSCASIALGALCGRITETDGSIGLNMPMTTAGCRDSEKTLVLLYEPDRGDLITPIVQLACTSPSESAMVLIDRLEVYLLEKGAPYPGALFCSASPGGAPNPSPTGTAFVPTPTKAGTVAEQEPNDRKENAQGLPAAGSGATIQVAGRLASGGMMGSQYTGDPDCYAFTLPSRTTIDFRMDWTEKADLDAYLWSGEQIIGSFDQVDEKPIQFQKTLEAGTYVLMIVSADNATDYSFTLKRTEPGLLPTLTPTRTVPPPTPTPPSNPTPTRTSTPAVTPTQPSSDTINEQEPNDLREQAQNAGRFSAGRSVSISGRLSTGGVDQEGYYKGDYDRFSFALASELDVTIRFEWAAATRTGFFLFDPQNNLLENIQSVDPPKEIRRSLPAGSYQILVLSGDTATDYALTIAAGGSGGPTPTRPANSTYDEEEPKNDTGQSLNTVSPGQTVNVKGRLSSGGYNDASGYTGDRDVYLFAIPTRSEVVLTLTWSGNADVDAFLHFNGQTICQSNQLENPIELRQTLEPGNYDIALYSADNATDYTLSIAVAGQSNPTPTPGSPGGNIQEVEPNDGSAQDLGTLPKGQSIRLTGNMSKGGYQGMQYSGDADFYSFTLAAQSLVTLTLDWAAPADLNFSVFQGSQMVGYSMDAAKPAAASCNLAPGTYTVLVISTDQPSNYSLVISSS